jgi:DNA-binding NtrC family response regulator
MPLDELTRDLDVLVVDDDPAVRELLLEYFTALGFRASGAPDGGGAIATLQRSWGRFGLVVTDLNLPGADGFAVLQAARQANSNCFVVIITGYASLDSAIRAVRVGAYDYLTKPFSLGQLDIILSRIRERRAQQVGHTMPATEPFASAAGHGTQILPATVPNDQHSTWKPLVAPAGGPSAAPQNVAQRLGQLEAAFGRIESLLREKR